MVDYWQTGAAVTETEGAANGTAEPAANGTAMEEEILVRHCLLEDLSIN